MPASDEQDSRDTVLIYAPHLLPSVQHYVREHAVRLKRYRPVMAGRQRIEGTPIGDFPNFTFGRGLLDKLRENRFLITGRDHELEAFVKRQKVKLVHAHFGPGGAEIMFLAARLKLPLVVTFHGWDVKLGAEATGRISLYERLYRYRIPRLLNQVAQAVCVSNNYRDRVIKLGADQGKVSTNYLGVDTDFFDGRRGTFNPASILYVGRLIKRKGVDCLLESLRILRERNIHAELTIVGEGSELPHLERVVKDHALSVRFLGKRPLTEVRDLMRHAAVLCAPSTTAGGEVPEALGLVFIEAQAMSVPVVGTRNGGIPETMLDGQTGLLVDEDSPLELADALATLLNDVPRNQIFGERARAFVCDRFSIERAYQNLEDVYDRLLNG